MSSMNSYSRLLALGLCGVALAGCDSIKDVREAPYTAVPDTKTVLQGTVTGLGSARPVYLDSGVTLADHERERSFFGSLGVPAVPFSYGAVPVGTPYNVTVRIQPYGMLCSVANGSGVAGDGSPDPAISCEDNPAIARYTVGGTVPLAVANLPGAKAILTTEEGVEELPLSGLTSFQFNRRVFGVTATNPPDYEWRVTATFTQDGTEYNCRMAPGTATGTNPTANITNVTIQACSFEVSANIQYSAPPGGTAQAMGAGGVTLELRQLGTAVPNVAPVTISAFSTSSVVLWPAVRSFTGAAYDLVVAEQPEGQTCIVRVLNGSTSMGSVIWLSDPAVSSNFTPAGASVRCRATPDADHQLTGTYMRTPRNDDGDITDRQFMTFFNDGTFLFAHHGNSRSNIGVEHGFYNYDPVGQTLDFNVFTDSSSTVSASINPPSLSQTLGWSGTVSSSTGGVARATNVQKTPGTPAQLAMTFTGPPAPPPRQPPLPSTSAEVVFSEPKSIEGQMAGPWVEVGDNRRLWVFNFDDTTGIHAGVNGPINLQEGCYVFDDSTAVSGYYVRRGGSTGCMTTGAGYASGFSTYDVPTGSAQPPGYFGKLPGSEGARDGRPPSPSLFEIGLSTPNTLTLQKTENGTPIDSPQVFVRSIIN